MNPAGERQAPGRPRIRGLVVDDSAFMRQTIKKLLESEGDIKVLAVARDGLDALEKVRTLKPDVITLDVEMPKLDGLGALRCIMAECPTPVVMISSLTQEQADVTLEALASGAVDFVPKPSGTISLDIEQLREQILQKVRVAATATPRRRRAGGVGQAERGGSLPAGAAVAAAAAAREPARLTATRQESVRGKTRPLRPPRRLVVIGSSTGGPRALHEVITGLPAGLEAGVLVIQHMPPGFTTSLAARLDQLSPIRVREAETGDRLEEGLVLLAPGGHHLLLDREGRVRIDDGPPVHGVRPAVDVTLNSVAEHFQGQVAAAILTGMGFDGARGAAAIRRQGGYVLAEDRSSCVVYGMPRAVVEMGLADAVRPLDRVAETLTEWVSGT